MGKGKAPAAPDYSGAAAAQGAANISAARSQTALNNPNVTNPYATQTTTFDPNTGQPTINQQYSPEQQALYNAQVQNQGTLGGVVGQAGQNLLGGIGTPIDYSSVPNAPIPGLVNQQIVNAMMQRPTADYARAKDQLGSDLAAGGIPVGSKAWQSQQDLLGRQLTDAQTQAELAGVNAGNLAFNQGTAATQNAQANLMARQSLPISQALSALQTAGPQALPQNMFSLPNASQNTQIAPAPVYNAAQQQGQYQTDVFNQQQAQQGNLMSGLFGLGSTGILAGAMSPGGLSGLMGLGGAGAGAGAAAGLTAADLAPYAAMAAASDRRLKSAIRRIGTHALGIGIYAYTIFGRREIGVMAQEVLTVKPEAVITMPNGYLAVCYGWL